MRWLEEHFNDLGKTISFYPNVTAYLFASGVIIAATNGTINAGVALLALLVGFIAILLLALQRETAITHREVANVHVLVNSQHDELMLLLGVSDRRVIQLTEALEGANVVVPDAPKSSENQP